MNRDNRHIDTERVIAEVKLRSCLWDSNLPQRKELKVAAWDEVVVAILGDISNKYKKDYMIKIIQQRWKTARDAFFRTKSYLKNGDPGKKFTKYMYYDELCFLAQNDANYALEETETQNRGTEESTEDKNTKVRILPADVLKPAILKRRNKRCRSKPQTKNDTQSDYQLENQPQNEFAKELLMLLGREESNVSSDDLFFFLSMGSILNTFDFRQKLEFRSKVLAAAVDVQNMYNRPSSSASPSSIPETAESPEDVKPKVELLVVSEYDFQNQTDGYTDPVI